MMTITAKATQQSGARYTIIETDLGPLISESRVSVFDVMDAYDAGDSVYEIDLTFNLSPLQVETALDYIAEHRAALEPVSYTHLRAHETVLDLVCRLLLEKKN